MRKLEKLKSEVRMHMLEGIDVQSCQACMLHSFSSSWNSVTDSIYRCLKEDISFWGAHYHFADRSNLQHHLTVWHQLSGWNLFHSHFWEPGWNSSNSDIAFWNKELRSFLMFCWYQLMLLSIFVFVL